MSTINPEKLNAFYDDVLKFKLTDGNLFEKGLIKITDEFDDSLSDTDIIKCKVYRKYSQLPITTDNFVAICKTGDLRSAQYMIQRYRQTYKNKKYYYYTKFHCRSAEPLFYKMISDGLHIAINNRYKDIVKMLLKIPKVNTLCYIEPEYKIDMIEILLIRKVRVIDYTIEYAILKNNAELIRLLLQYDSYNNLGLILRIACQNNNLPIVKMLINRNLSSIDLNKALAVSTNKKIINSIKLKISRR